MGKNRIRHVGIIMDGNGRWAQQRGCRRLEGHAQRAQTAVRMVDAALERGLQALSLFVFSTENRAREPTEVQGILETVGRTLLENLDHFHRQGVRIRVIGEPLNLPPLLTDAIDIAVTRTSGNCQLALQLALNYGGRADIVRAVKSIVHSGIDAATVGEQLVREHLSTGDLPDPDLLIRTGGDSRLSNFFLFQAAYSHLEFTPTLWPDFSPHELQTLLRRAETELRDASRRREELTDFSAST